MNDLLNRLRNYAPDGCDYGVHEEAADKIEELEAQIRDNWVDADKYDNQQAHIDKLEAQLERVRWCVNGMDNVLWRGVGAKLREVIDGIPPIQGDLQRRLLAALEEVGDE